MQVLIVEDDEALARALTVILREAHYDVDVVGDGPTGLSWAALKPYDVIVLDVMLPGMDGFEVVAELRRQSVSTPVLLLTARDSVADKIQGLDSGADDYMTKPFSPAELMAHLRALTRRQGDVVFETLTFADLSLNLESMELSCGDKVIHLSQREHGIMQALMTGAGRVSSKEALLERVWGASSNAEVNSVEVYISFLRKKLTYLESRARIETLRGAGYRLAETAPQG